MRPEEVLTLRVSIPESIVPTDEQAVRTHEQIVRKLEGIPGVRSVGVSNSITMDGNDSNDPIFVEDFPPPADKIPPLRRFKWTAQNYFQTMGNPIVAGREMTWADVLQPRVGGDGQRELRARILEGAGGGNRQAHPADTKQPVAHDHRRRGQRARRRHREAGELTIIYWPLLDRQLLRQQDVRAAQCALCHADGPRPESPTLLKEIQQAVWSVNANLPVANVRTLEQIRADSMAQTSFALVMLGIAAAVALLLGVVGIYGVIAYVAQQRTKEIGIRMALGAASRDVSALFVRHGHRARRHRHRLRDGRGGAADAHHVGAALRRQRLRSGHLRRRRPGARRHRGHRQLPSRAPGVTNRSGGGASLGGVAWFRVQGSGFRVQGSGFKGSGKIVAEP